MNLDLNDRLMKVEISGSNHHLNKENDELCTSSITNSPYTYQKRMASPYVEKSFCKRKLRNYSNAVKTLKHVHSH